MGNHACSRPGLQGILGPGRMAATMPPSSETPLAQSRVLSCHQEATCKMGHPSGSCLLSEPSPLRPRLLEVPRPLGLQLCLARAGPPCAPPCDLLNHRAPDPHLSQAWPQLLGGPPLVSAPTVGHHCVPGVSLLQIWAPSWRPQPTPPHPPWGLAGARSQLLPPCPGPSCQVSPHMGQRPS